MLMKLTGIFTDVSEAPMLVNPNIFASVAVDTKGHTHVMFTSDVPTLEVIETPAEVEAIYEQAILDTVAKCRNLEV